MNEQPLDASFRLSPQQEHLWKSQGGRHRPDAAVQGVVDVPAPVTAAELGAALRELARRHEVLRTWFPVPAGMAAPVQAIGPEATVELAAVSGEVETQAREAREALDPARPGGAWSARWLDADPGQAGGRLLLTFSPLVADERTVFLVAAELAALVASADAGDDVEEEPFQYADSAEVFHEWLDEDEGDGAGFWDRRAPARAPEPAVAPLAPSSTGSPEAGSGLHRLTRPLDSAVADGLARRAETAGVAVGTLVSAAFRRAWSVSTGLAAPVVAERFGGRTVEEFETALGVYDRHLPVGPGDSSGTDDDLTAAARALEAARGTVASFQDVVTTQALARSMAPADGAGVVWPLVDGGDRAAAGDGPYGRWPVSLLATAPERFALRWGHLGAPPRALVVDVDRRWASPERAEGLLERAGRLLEHLAGGEDGRVSLVTDAELEELDTELVGPGRPCTDEPLALERVLSRLAAEPDAPALVAGDERWSAARLARRTAELASRLAAAGVGRGDRVAVLLDRRADLPAVLLAVWHRGAAYLPIDPSYPRERIDFVLGDSGAALVVTSREHGPHLAGVAAPQLAVDDDASAPSDVTPVAVGPDDLAYVIYTSGSTGVPKGVMVHHGGLANYLAWAAQEYGAGAGETPVHSSIGFDLTVTSLLAPLAAGGTLRLLPEEAGVEGLAAVLNEDPEGESAPVALLKITPAHLAALRHLAPAPRPVGTLVLGGEALHAQAVDWWRQASPATRVVNEYGPTETVVGCTVHVMDGETADSGAVSIGRPIANTRVHVVDRLLERVPPGVSGELLVGGVGVARGYLGRPALTAERFVPDPFAANPGGRLYRTGDLVRWVSGEGLEFLGRLDEQVKIRGFRIEPAEIATVLAEHPGVAEAVVLARAATAAGAAPADKRLVAYLVPAADGAVPADRDLAEHLGRRLPDYMVPAVFVHLPEIPLTRHGKVDSAALPDPESVVRAAPYTAPRTPDEELLAGLWARALERDRVGIDDDFFALGGDSIRSIQVLSLAAERGVEVSVHEIFQQPTVRRLAAYLVERGRDGGGRPERASLASLAPVAPFELVSPADRERLEELYGDSIEAAYPLSRLQAGMVFHSRLDPDSAVYHDLHSFHLEGRFRPALLEQAVAQVVERHETLRTAFDLASFGEPLQIVHREVTLNPGMDDLTGLDPDERQRAVTDWLRRERERPFDWSTAPLARVHVHRRTETTFQFTLSFHHSVLDGWSAASLLTELFGRYAALVAGRPWLGDGVEPEGVAYRDFVALERQTVASDEARRFWMERLDGSVPADLPRTSLDEDDADSHAEELAVAIPEQLSDGVLALARELAVPPKSVLLAAHLRVMAHLAGADKVTTGLVSNGRPEWGNADRLLGLFLNTLPLALDVSEAASWRQLVSRTFDLERAALAHRRFPLADLQIDRGGPLFAVAFNFLHYHVYRQIEAIGELKVVEGTGYEETNFPLVSNFGLDLDGTRLYLVLAYARSLVSRRTAERVGELYLAALGAAIADPEARPRDLDLLSAEERSMLLAWGRGRTPAPAAGTVLDLVLHQAARAPEAPAVLAADGSTLTFGALASSVHRLARQLSARGVEPGARVGVAAGRSPELVVALLAVLEAGAAYVPLDPSQPDERLRFLAEDTGLSLVVTTAGTRPIDGLESVERLVVDAPATAAEREALPAESPGLDLDPDLAAYVLHTSGSTGRPKGVVVTHRGLAAYVTWARDAYRVAPGPPDRRGDAPGQGALLHSPLTFDLTVTSLFVPLAAGAPVRLVADEGGVEALVDALVAHPGSSLLKLTPSHLLVLGRLLAPADLAAAARTLVVGGEALDGEMVERWRRAAPGLTVVNEYGPTETVVGCVVHEVAPGEDLADGPVAIGRPIDGVRVAVVDRSLRLAAPGAAGELAIAGPGLAQGYLGRPGRTAESFVPDPLFSAGDGGGRLYRTGDRVRFDAHGRLEFLGRVDDQIKVRGHRVEPGEIESALQAHPAVAEAAVVVRPAETGGGRLVAWVVAAGGAEAASPEALRAHLAERLPAHLVPDAFGHVDALPLTVHGKVDRKALAARTLPELAGSAGPAVAPAGTEAPQGEMEQLVARLWAGVLGRDSVGLDDNFFDLGGHSLLLLQVQARLEVALGREVAMIALFRHPTVRRLARHLSGDGAAEGMAGTRGGAPAVVSRRSGRSRRSAGDDRIAVVGASGRFPGAASVEELWADLVGGVESIRFFSEDELAAAGVPPRVSRAPGYVPADGALDDVDLFDAGFFGLTPREAEVMDPQQRLFLECAWEALESAGRVPGGAGVGAVGVFAGASVSGYLWNLLSDRPTFEGVGPYRINLATDKDFLATRVAYQLGLTGPAVSVQSACSTSLVAIHLACRSLLDGECDLALAGGSTVRVPQGTGYQYEEGGIRSSDGHCRAFDAAGDGMVGGSGVGVVALKRLDAALADGDPIRAVVLGSAINNDGAAKVGFTAPGVDGQVAVVRGALERAGVDARSIGYVEAHGTGTTLGDPIEVAALTEAFRASTDDTGFCGLGSVKSHVGHLDAAAGVTGFLQAMLAVERGVMPPSLHFETPNPRIDFANSPFYVVAEPTPWASGHGDGPRRAGVSSFGIGGTNAHVVIEAAPEPTLREAAAAGPFVVPLSARTPEALDRATVRLAEHLVAHPDLDLGDVTRTLVSGRRAWRHRRAVVADDPGSLAAALAGGDGVVGAAGESARRVVFLLSGQGSQFVGMGAALRTEPAAWETLEWADEILRPRLGRSLLDLVAPADQATGGADELAAVLDDTAFAQPALFALEVALGRAWAARGVEPAAMLGHSVGEYAAACLSGVFDFDAGVELMAERGRLIAGLDGPAGAMAAVSLGEEAVGQHLGRHLKDELSLAAVNGADRVVVSGRAEAVDALVTNLAADGISARRLATSHAFHSSLMDPVVGPFTELVAGIELRAPERPFVSCLTGDWITPEEATDPDYWARHLRGTVRFADALETVLADGEPAVLEVGPGAALVSLARRTEAGRSAAALVTSLPAPSRSGAGGAGGDRGDRAWPLAAAAARLWSVGVELDDRAFGLEGSERRVALPTYPFERRRHWVERGQALAAVATTAARPVSDWFHAPAWRAAPLPARSSERAAETARTDRWLVFADRSGWGDHLAAALEARGAEPRVVPPGDDDWRSLLDGVGAQADGRRLRLLWARGLDVPPPADAEAAVDSLLEVVERVAALDCRAELALFGRRVLALPGERVERLDDALALDLARRVERELPGIAGRFFDVASDDLEALAARVVDDLLSGDGPAEVVWRDAGRWTAEPVPTPLPEASGALGRQLPPEPVVLVTGGLDGAGLALARGFARLPGARLVLADRDPLPSALARLQALAAQVLVVAADPGDADAMERLGDTLEERFGRLDAALHVAGVGGDRPPGLTDRPALGAHLASTVRGAHHLVALARRFEPASVVFCSSLDALFDAAAERLAAEGLPAQSFQWSQWPDGADPGRDAFERAVASRLPRLTIAPLDPAARRAESTEPAREAAERPTLATEPAAAVHGVEREIAEIWTGVLGIDGLGAQDDFFELGGDSLVAIQVVSRLSRAFGIELPVTVLFDHPTLRSLAGEIEATVLARTAPVDDAVGDRRGLDAAQGSPHPLSFGQRRLWFLDQLWPGSSAYNSFQGLRLTGRASLPALAFAVDRVVARHEVLRSTFAPGPDGDPVQRVRPPSPSPLPVVDLGGLPVAARESRIERLAAAFVARPFDLAEDAPLRLLCLRLTADEHVLVLAFHHIVVDEWSMGILMRELVAFYRQATEGLPAAVPELAVQYGHYARWQRRFMDSDVYPEQLRAAVERLTGAPDALALPTDRPRSPVQRRAGAHLGLVLDAATSEAARALGRRHGATLYMVLLSAVDVLLHRWSGQDDLLVGSPVSHRPFEEVESLIGLFVNTLVLRQRLVGDWSFERLLGEVRAGALLGFEQQEVPFEQLVERLDVSRDPSRPPLFQVLFVLQNAPVATFELPGLTLAPLAVESGTSRVDLGIELWDRGDAVGGVVEYDTDLYDRTTVERFAAQLVTLLRAAVAAPGTPLDRLPLLDSGARHQLLVEWSGPGWEPASDALPVHGRIAARAAERPDAPAAILGDRTVTYGELVGRSAALAAELTRLGVGPEDRVGLLAERGPEAVVGMLACWGAGAAFVPVDPAYPAERVALMLDDAGVSALLVAGDGEARAAVPDGFDRPVLPVPTDDGAVAGGGLLAGPARADDSLAYVIFTSGSLGRPKGVMVGHRSFSGFATSLAERVGLGASSRMFQFASLSFDASLLQIFPPLVSGGSVVFHPRPGRLSPREIVELSERHQVSVLDLPAAVWRNWIDTLSESRERLLPRVRLFLTGGESLSAEHLEAWRRLPAADDARLGSSYGPTEATVTTTLYTLDAHHGRPVEGQIPLGLPLAGTRVHLLGPGLDPAPVGVTGELYLGGAGLARGYLGDPARTAAVFVPDPHGGVGDRLYRTGDLARRRRDGELVFLGRADHQVKIRGFRVEPGEIAAQIAALPEVAEATVVVHAERLVAYLVAAVGASVDPAAVGAHLAERLPEHMVPAAFVVLDRMPLLASGKIDRRALPAPDPAGDAADGPVLEPPRGPIEETLVEIWKQVLGRDRVGVHEDFFEAGGHSLLATRVVGRVREVFQVELPLQVLFDGPTVARIARRVEESLGTAITAVTALPPLTPGAWAAGPDGVVSAPLAPAQERLWFLDQLQPGGSAYNIPGTVGVAGELSEAVLGRALDLVRRRHGALRTTFGEVGGKPVQRISPRPGPPLAVVDLQGLPRERAWPAARALAAAWGARPFDLERGPLLRAGVVRIEPGRRALLLAMHHIVSDGWSMGVLVSELTTAYGALARGAEPALPPLPVQYADVAVWQRRLLDDGFLDDSLEFWRRHLQGAPTVLDLPTDRPRPALAAFRGDTRRTTLSPELSEAARQLARTHGVSVFMTLLSLYGLALGRLTGQRDLLVATAVANRDPVEVEPLIGFFVNTLPLRVRLDEGASFADLLAATRGATLASYAHQQVPFEKVIEAVGIERDLAHNPLCQVMLVLQNLPETKVETGGLTLGPLVGDGETVDGGGGGAGTAKFDLTLYAWDLDGGLDLGLEYDTDLFDRTTILRLLDGLTTLLTAVVETPERRLDELSMMGPAARHQVLVDWREGPALAADGPGLLHELFFAQARRTPRAVALLRGGREFSYGELDGRARSAAAALAGRGVRPETRVGLCLERGDDLLVAFLGILAAGGVVVPVDPAYPAERQRYLLADSGARFLVSRAELASDLGADPPRLLEPGELARPGEAAGSVVAPRPEHLAYVMYTSGSTGAPKGVAVEHRAIVSTLRWAPALLGTAERRRSLVSTSVCFDPFLFELFGAWQDGQTAVLVDDALGLAELAPDVGVTLVSTVPSALDQLLRSGDLPASVETVVLAGEALPGDLARRLGRETGVGRLLNLYGPTEDSIYATGEEVALDLVGEPTIGRSIPGSEALVVDVDLRALPPGAPGELLLGGAGLARGYAGRPARTAESFVPHPAPRTPGARVYRSGDLVRWSADGRVVFLGRIDRQVKVRGFRVELAEVEAALRDLDGVETAVAIARGRGAEQRLVAYVEPAVVSGDELRGRLAERLPRHAVPSVVTALERLPRLPNGKVDAAALPDAPGRPSAEPAPQGRANPTEELVAEIWSDVLGVEAPASRDDFFALGGHSLLATQVAVRLRDAFRLPVELRALFEHPTLAALASHLDELRRQGLGLDGGPIAAVHRRAGDTEVLSSAQRRLFFLDRLHPGSPFYNIPILVGLDGGLDLPALAGALAGVVQSHEVLRTTYHLDDGGVAFQRLEPFAGLPLPVVDLGGLDDPRAEAEQERLLAAAARRGFDLERGPVIRALLVRRTARLHAAAIVVHHVATDGWSMGVLMGDVEASYRAAVEGRPAPDRRPPIQYADFAAWEAERFAGETAAALEEHWRRALAGAPRVTELPGDRPRPPRQGDRGAERQRTVGPDLTRRLEALGRERSATPFMVLAAVLGLVLHARTGATDLVIGTDVAARTRRETEGLIGFFINQMPVRLDLAGDPTFLELLARVREATLDGYAHQELPFDRLVGLLDLPRDPSRSPLFQIKLVLHNTPMEGLSLPDLRLVPLDLVDTTAQLDLNLRTSIGAAGLWLSFQYATDLYDRSTIDDLLADVERALDLATEDPLHTVSQLAERLAAHERRRREERERELASRDRQRLGSLKRRGARRARTLNIDPEEDRP